MRPSSRMAPVQGAAWWFVDVWAPTKEGDDEDGEGDLQAGQGRERNGTEALTRRTGCSGSSPPLRLAKFTPLEPHAWHKDGARTDCHWLNPVISRSRRGPLRVPNASNLRNCVRIGALPQPGKRMLQLPPPNHHRRAERRCWVRAWHRLRR